MAALLDKGKIARAREARKQKRASILKAARHIFTTQPYATVELDHIGRRAGVAKGIASLYFGSKEELFLQVLRKETDGWFDKIGKKLGGIDGEMEAAELAGLLAEDLTGKRPLTRLVSLLHNVMEENVDILPAQAFLDHARDQVVSLGELLEKKCSALEPGEGGAFLRRLQLLVVGLNQTSNLSGIFAALLREDDMKVFHATYREELEELIRKILPRGQST